MDRRRTALVDRLEASGKDYVWYLSQLSDAELHTPPAPNEWTIHEVAAHMRDTEQKAFLPRTERIMREEHPAVENFDQEAWNREHYRPDEPLKKIISGFLQARRKVTRLLRQTANEDWENWAMHSEYGKISLDWLTEHNYGHTLEHIAQIANVHNQTQLKELNGRA